MLKKNQRLDRLAFSSYFNKGKRYHSPYLTIIHSPAEVFLSSVVVGKKVSKKAPVRNTIRRRIYSQIQKIKHDQNLTGVFIIITKPELLKLSRKALADIVELELGRVLN